MVQAIIKLGNHEDRVLNIVKGKYGLKNKSEAINLIIQKHEKQFLEPELRPEYVEKLRKIKSEKGVSFKNVKELKKSIEKRN